MPLYHCAQLYCFLMPGLYLGATNVILPGADPARHPRRDRGATGDQAVLPADGLDRVAAPPGLRRDATCRRCARATTARRAMPVEVLREIAERAARRAPVQLLRPDRDVADGDAAAARGPAAQGRLRRASRRSTSRPASSTTTGQPVPPGEVGEIVHRSPHAMLGYWNDPERRPRRSATAGSTAATSASIDDEGYLNVVDRKKDMIKTGGENVASREVEEAIYAHPAVAEVAIFGIPRPALDRGRDRRRRPARRRGVERRRAGRVLPRAPRRLQGAQVRRPRRRAAQERERQDPQARAAATYASLSEE